MAKISDAEVRRLLSHIKDYVDGEVLEEIEDELRGDDAEEYLREPDLLEFFPEIFDEFSTAGKNWKLRVIPHAHLRMVQRGVKLNDASAFLHSFANLYFVQEQSLFTGHYSIYGRIKARNLYVTIRIDVDLITNVKGEAHVVTVHLGRGNTEGMIKVELLD